MEQWEFIEKAAAELGVGAEAIRKSRVRGVPHQWRIGIIEAAEREQFDLDRGEFDRPPGAKRNAGAAAPELREAS